MEPSLRNKPQPLLAIRSAGLQIVVSMLSSLDKSRGPTLNASSHSVMSHIQAAEGAEQGDQRGCSDCS